MAIRVAYKLSRKEHDLVWKFCQELGVPMETVAKQSLFWAINEAYDRAEKELANGKSASGVAIGDTEETPESQSTSTDLLAKQEESGVSSPTGSGS